ncbi:MAG: endonuclease V, partial [Candidatus Helarchaeales archaeon]
MTAEKLLQLSESRGKDLDLLKKYQIEVAKKIIIEDEFESISTVTGVDVAYHEDFAFAACITMSIDMLEVIEVASHEMKVEFPYISTYFVFREGPVILKCLEKLKKNIELLLIDAHGIMHPRGIGTASHVGVILDKPTIGVAKNPLFGKVDIKSPEKSI